MKLNLKEVAMSKGLMSKDLSLSTVKESLGQGLAV